MTRNIVSVWVALLPMKSGFSLGEASKQFKDKKDLALIDALQSVVASNWEWPAVKQRFKPHAVLKSLVTEKRFNRSQNSLRADASELVTFYPILRLFAETCCTNIEMGVEITSLLLLCTLLDYIWSHIAREFVQTLMA